MVLGMSENINKTKRRLHEVFGRYRDVALLPSGSSCASNAEQLEQIRRTLTATGGGALDAAVLLDYYYLAVEHIGSVDDLRHFLPSLLECVITSPRLLVPAHLPELLKTAGFSCWARDERCAVAGFVSAAALAGCLPPEVAAEVERQAQVMQ